MRCAVDRAGWLSKPLPVQWRLYSASATCAASSSAFALASASRFSASDNDAGGQGVAQIHVPSGNFESDDAEVLLNPGYVVCGEGEGTVFHKNGIDQLFSTQQAPPSIADGELAADAGTGTAYLNSVQLATGEGAAFTVGQTCLLVSEEAITTAAGDKKAQIVTIQSIAGDLVRFWETLRYSFSVAKTARLVPLTLASGVGYRDLRIIMDDTITLESSLGFHPNFGIDVQFAHDVVIDNVGVKRAVGPMISLRGVKGALLTRIRGSDGGSTTSGSDDPKSTEGAGGWSYGVSLTGLNQGIVVNGGHFERIRHAVTTGGFYSSLFNYGEPVSAIFANLVALGMKNAAFDTHQAGRDLVFDTCMAGDGLFAGFQIRSAETRIGGKSSARDMLGPAVWVRGSQSAGIAGDRCQITDFSAERTNLGISLGTDWTQYGAILDEGYDTLINGLRAIKTAGPAITTGRNGVARRSIYKNIDATDICQNTVNKAVVHIIDTNFTQDVFINDLNLISTDSKVEDLVKVDTADVLVHLRDVNGIGYTGARIVTVEPNKVDDGDTPLNPYFKSFGDDFLGYALDGSKWRTHKGSHASAAFPAAFAGEEGKCRLVTGADAAGTMATNGSELLAGQLWIPSRGTITSRFRVNASAISNLTLFVGFTDTAGALEMPFTMGSGNVLTSIATDAVGFLFDTAADTNNWWLVGVKADVDAVKQNTGSAPASGTWYWLDIIIAADGSAQFYINMQKVGVTMANAVSVSTPLFPVVAAFSRGAASRNIDVDMVTVQQDRFLLT